MFSKGKLLHPQFLFWYDQRYNHKNDGNDNMVFSKERSPKSFSERDNRLVAAQNKETGLGLQRLGLLRLIRICTRVGKAAAYEGYLPSCRATERLGGFAIAVFLEYCINQKPILCFDEPVARQVGLDLSNCLFQIR